jgi:hypothetical protein
MFKSLLSFASLLVAAAALPAAGDTGISAIAARVTIPTESHVLPCVMAANLGCPSAPTKTTGDKDDGKSHGIILHNDDTAARSFFFYKNSCECIPYKYISIPAKGQAFVSLATGFQGRIMRGTEKAMLDGASHILGSWAEFTIDSTGIGWGDVSLIKGCDGAVAIKSLDGSNSKTGFSQNLLSGAPDAAYKLKSVTGSKAIMETESLVDANVINAASRDYLAGKLGYNVAYIDDHHTNPVIRSGNGRFDVTMYAGTL